MVSRASSSEGMVPMFRQWNSRRELEMRLITPRNSRASDHRQAGVLMIQNPWNYQTFCWMKKIRVLSPGHKGKTRRSTDTMVPSMWEGWVQTRLKSAKGIRVLWKGKLFVHLQLERGQEAVPPYACRLFILQMISSCHFLCSDTQIWLRMFASVHTNQSARKMHHTLWNACSFGEFPALACCTLMRGADREWPARHSQHTALCWPMRQKRDARRNGGIHSPWEQASVKAS